MSEKSRGQQIVEEWAAEIDKRDDDSDWDDLADLASRIDAGLAKSAPKRVLDLSRFVVPMGVITAIRAQLSDVEVRT